MDLVTYERRGKVALLGLNRPEKRNALNAAMIDAIRDAVQRAGEEAEAGVLFGHGPNFSSGLDLAELAARMSAAAPRGHRRRPHPWHTTFDLIARGSIPWVAALHGPTIGGGFELAAAAHIRVADATAVFGLPEGQRGIFVGGGGTVRIQRLVGYAAMADMMLTGRLHGAQQAERLGMAQYVVGAGEALEKALELAAAIANNTPQTNWQITSVLPRINDLSHDDGLFMESLNSAMARPPESLERLQAFLEKRAPPLQRPD